MESYKRIIAIGNNPSAIGTALSGDSEKAVIRETQELNRLINISKRNAGIK